MARINEQNSLSYQEEQIIRDAWLAGGREDSIIEDFITAMRGRLNYAEMSGKIVSIRTRLMQLDMQLICAELDERFL